MHPDPVIHAIKTGDLEYLKTVIKNVGFHFSPTWNGGYSLLCTSLYSRQQEVSSWLIHNGCKIHQIKGKFDDTPLHIAVQLDEMSLILKLLQQRVSSVAKNNQGQTPLHISCCRKNLEVTQLLLNYDSSAAHLTDAFFNTPFHIAVENNAHDIINLLLKYKINLNAHTLSSKFLGFTPLHIAVKNQNYAVVQTLLMQNVDIEAGISTENFKGLNENKKRNILYKNYTPLQLAMELNNQKMIDLLETAQTKRVRVIEIFDIGDEMFNPSKKMKKEDINFEYDNPFRPVPLDSKSSYDPVIQHETENNENLNNQILYKDIYLIVQREEEKLLQILISCNVDINIKNCFGQSPLHLAVYNSSLNIAQILLKAGANINEVDKCDNTPLGIAIKNKRLNMVEMLLSYNPVINNACNIAALNYAIKNYDQDFSFIVDLLLRYGFTEVDLIDINCGHIINLSFENDCMAIVDLIIGYIVDSKSIDIYFSINLNVKSKIIEYLVSQKKINEIKFFLNNGYDLGDFKQQIIEYNDTEITNLLLENIEEKNDFVKEFLTSAKKKNLDMIKKLLSQGANVNCMDEFGTTGLHFAAWNDDYDLVMYLLRNNAIINHEKVKINQIHPNNNEKEEIYCKYFTSQIFTTPLHIAVLNKNEIMFTELLENHADVNAQDGYGRTALHIASAMISTKQKKIIEILFKYGANMNIVDTFNRLPFNYAFNYSCMCNVAFQNEYELYNECDCYEESDNKDVIVLYIKHIAVMSHSSQIIDQHLSLLNTEELNEFFLLCICEVSKMKEEIFGNITYLYFLTRKSNALAACVGKAEVSEKFESIEIEKEFPLYSDLLKERYDLAKIRKNLLGSAASALVNLTKFNLPFIVTHKIMDHLQLNDLRNLRDASVNR